MTIGMDFGTTNSGAAYFDGERVHLLKLDSDSSTPEVCRSAIYMTRNGEYYLGSSAIQTYFAQNIGRPTRYRKVRVGEIAQIFAELPVFYRDVYIFEDEFSPGRLFTSIKTALRSRDYLGTAFRGAWYSPSDLVAIFLMGMRLQMESQLSRPVQKIVLGRPVSFSTQPDEDQVAQSRLLDAAFKAGFEEVSLEYEPIAAALAYGLSSKKRECILVYDFGGGTLDFTIMVIGGRGKAVVLATGGVPIAGDIFDQRLFRVVIPRHLGEGSEYLSGGVKRPVPAHIFDTLSQPHEILSLNTPQNLEMLRRIQVGSFEPHQIQALLKVISSNYALMMFDLVEQAKRRLSSEYLTQLVIDTPDFSIREQISRPKFERAIAQEAEIIRNEILATLAKANLRPAQIDKVIRTGGSSQIPLFVNLLTDMFGHEKVQAIDIFSSVTSGLAIRAYQLETDQVEMTVYKPDSSSRASENTLEIGDGDLPNDDPKIRPANLEDIHQRLQIRLKVRREPDQLPKAVIFLCTAGGLFALPVEQAHLQQDKTRVDFRSWVEKFGITPNAQTALVGINMELLIATDQMKFMTLKVSDLLLAQQVDPHQAIDALPLDVEERVTAILAWNPQHLRKRLVCMVTATGQGRAFEAATLSETLSHRSYYQLERRYQGFPVGLVAADPGEDLIIGTSFGRVARSALDEMTIQAIELIRLKKKEHIAAVLATQENRSLLAMDSHGRVTQFITSNLPKDKSPAQRAQAISRNFPLVFLLDQEDLSTQEAWGVTDQGRLIHLNLIEYSKRNASLDPFESFMTGFLG